MKRIVKNKINRIVIGIIFLKNRFLKKIIKKKNKNINILFIIGKISNGGAERACVNLAEELNKKYNVKIAIFNEEKNEYKCNVPIIKIGKGQNSSLKRIIEISKIKRKNNITHTISFLVGPNYTNVITSRKDKAIISVRNYMSDSHKEKKKDIKKHKIACRFADKIVSVSHDVEKDQLENWKIKKEKSLTITNFVDEEKITDGIKNGNIEKADEYIFENSKVVINVGRLVEQKGQEHLIRAFKEVVKEISDAKLIILGIGELRESLDKLILELDLEKNVFLLGFRKNPYAYMSESKVFVSSSYYEGMSNVVLEAMKCNLPIIATDCNGGNREILTDNNKEFGILVPVCKNNIDEKFLAREIIKLLKNEDIRQKYVIKSKRRITHYNKEKIVKQWEELLKE